MADPEPPLLELRFRNELRQLFASCELHCEAFCCGFGAFELTPDHIANWMRGQPRLTVLSALCQLEGMLNPVATHHGPVWLREPEGDYFVRWESVSECFAEFTPWRRAIAEAVSQLPEPRFFSPSWLTEPVVGLSAAIAAERAFDRLPILADALEEAGCDNPMMLAHLRANDDHAHHCWVVDVLRVGGGANL